MTIIYGFASPIHNWVNKAYGSSDIIIQAVFCKPKPYSHKLVIYLKSIPHSDLKDNIDYRQMLIKFVCGYMLPCGKLKLFNFMSIR
jgi:hypothetical protein